MTQASHPKRTMFQLMARTAQALASGPRIEIIDLLAQGERSVQGIADATGLSLANASQHVQHLRRAGLLSSRRVGSAQLCQLSSNDILGLYQVVRETTEHHSGEARDALERLYGQRDTGEPIRQDELLRKLKRKSAVLVDVRPECEFAAAHIPGAVSIPVTQLSKRLREIPRNNEAIAYCRGPYCVYAYEALEVLRPAGYSARRLLGGFIAWRLAGLPIESHGAAPAR